MMMLKPKVTILSLSNCSAVIALLEGGEGSDLLRAQQKLSLQVDVGEGIQSFG